MCDLEQDSVTFCNYSFTPHGVRLKVILCSTVRINIHMYAFCKHHTYLSNWTPLLPASDLQRAYS